MILTEIQDASDNPQTLLLNMTYLAAFKAHPYRNRSTGAVVDILHLTADDVRDFWKRWYVPNNMSVVVVGDILPARAFALVDAAFGAAKSAPLPSLPAAEAAPATPVVTHVPALGDEVFQALAFAAPGIGDLNGTVMTDVLTELLTGDRSLLLAQWAQDRVPVFDFGVEYVSARGPGRFIVWALTKPEDVERLKASTLRLFTNLQATPLPPLMVSAARQRLATSQVTENETYTQQAAMLAFFEGLNAPSAPAKYPAALAAVTPETIRAAMPFKLAAWVTLGRLPEGGH